MSTHVGRVRRPDRGACDVLVGDDVRRATWGADVLAAAAADPEDVPVPGDEVSLLTWADGRTTVEAVLPRRTVLRRAQAGRSSHGQVLAANVDVVLVVEGLTPDPDLGRLERLLALGWASGATPVVVMTKADLVADPELLVAEVGEHAPGCRVLAVAAPSLAGFEAVRDVVGQGVAALLGASGAGKSTLLNGLVGATVMRTRALRHDGRGRHTTVTRELHPLPGGGWAIDTPGLRSVGLLGAEHLEDVFSEIEELSSSCRFSDCSHSCEPGCAVLAAVDSGQMPERRLMSYRKLLREVEYQASRSDARLRAERAWRRKATTNAVARHPARPPRP